MALEIHVSDEQSDLLIDQSKVKQVIPAILSFHQVNTDEVSFHFVTDQMLCDLHGEFFNDPSSTDCITFPIDGLDSVGENESHVLGEVFVCPLTAKRYAFEHELSPYGELLLYVVHGILHLIGYDDIEEEDREQMRHQEARTLDHLNTLGLSLEPGIN